MPIRNDEPDTAGDMGQASRFQLVSDYSPTGDQPEAIEQLVSEISAGERFTCLLGATGTGKTFTMANVIARLNKPTLIISHNKTLAAQLYEELRGFFPENSVNYFVSYYDYYQPEAYIPQRDIYIEKDASRNDDLEQLRLAATSNLLSRRDTVVIASVSCIFGLGSPEAYGQKLLTITRGGGIGRRDFFLALNSMQYARADIDFKRGTYRARGDAIEVWPAYEKFAVRIEMFGDEIDRIELINPVSGELLDEVGQFFLFPAVHYVMPEEQLETAVREIRAELDERVAQLRAEGKVLEAQRLLARTKYDLELIEEGGICPGIENYSRFMDGRKPGERPFTLMDYFDYAPPATDAPVAPVRDDPAPEPGSSHAEPGAPGLRRNAGDWLVIIDESHVTIPQIHAMFNGDRARKQVLVEHGFRLPSALDNRPVRFEEWEAMVPRVMFVSATPSAYELRKTDGRIAEQVIRPTGLLDPRIEVRPARDQVTDLLERCKERVERGERVLVTALTKRLCEDLTKYLHDQGLKVRYLHSEIETLERITLLTELRSGEFDVLVGVNLLREGLDLPEVSLVAILDADKEGFLRSPTSLIQTIGRAARNSGGEVVMYADTITPSMRSAIEETDRRRDKQAAYNEANGITPVTIAKPIRRGIETEIRARKVARDRLESAEEAYEAGELVRILEEEMFKAAEDLDFEKAASLRDQAARLRDMVEQAGESATITRSELEAALGGASSARKAGMPGVKSGRQGKRGRKARKP